MAKDEKEIKIKEDKRFIMGKLLEVAKEKDLLHSNYKKRLNFELWKLNQVYKVDFQRNLKDIFDTFYHENIERYGL